MSEPVPLSTCIEEVKAMIGGPRDKVHWRMPQPVPATWQESACGLKSFTLVATTEFTTVTCQACLRKLEEGLEHK